MSNNPTYNTMRTDQGKTPGVQGSSVLDLCGDGRRYAPPRPFPGKMPCAVIEFKPAPVS